MKPSVAVECPAPRRGRMFVHMLRLLVLCLVLMLQGFVVAFFQLLDRRKFLNLSPLAQLWSSLIY